MAQNSLMLVRTGDQVLDRNFDAIKQMFRAVALAIGSIPREQESVSGVGVATITSIGGYFAPGTAEVVLLSGTEDLVGINVGDRVDGDVFWVVFVTPRNIINLGSPASGALPIDLGVNGPDPNMSVTGGSRAAFMPINGECLMVAAPVMGNGGIPPAQPGTGNSYLSTLMGGMF